MNNNATVTITFRHMDHSPDIEQFARKELERLHDFLDQERTPTTIALVIEAQPVHAHHKIDLHITTPNYNEFVHNEGPDIHSTIKSVISKMHKRLDHAKGRKDARQQGKIHGDGSKHRP